MESPKCSSKTFVEGNIFHLTEHLHLCICAHIRAGAQIDWIDPYLWAICRDCCCKENHYFLPITKAERFMLKPREHKDVKGAKDKL